MFEEMFQHRKLNRSKLLAYGFKEVFDEYRYTTAVMNGNFILHVTVDASGKVNTSLIEQDTGEEYVLYKIKSASGGFIGDVKCVCQKALADIEEKCYDPDIFRWKQSKEIIEYIREQYHDELEFLWKKSPGNAVWRRKDTGKWYGVILTISRKKLGLPSDEIVEIIDLRLQPEIIREIVDGRRYFPGWHMNKKSWYTIILDNCVRTEEICKRIDESYLLAVK